MPGSTLLRFCFITTSIFRIPPNPFAPESQTPAAALPLPPHPGGLPFVRAGQGWRTAYACTIPFATGEDAKRVLDTFPEPRVWMVLRAASAHHAARKAHRWQLRSWQRMAARTAGNTPPRRVFPQQIDRAIYSWTKRLTLERGWAVKEALQNDPVRALSIAETVPNPWSRSHDLADVARALMDPQQRDHAIMLALEAADEYLIFGDRNRAAEAAMWPLQVLEETGQVDWLRRDIERRLPWIRAESHPFRRADGLRSLSFHCLVLLPDLAVAILTEAAVAWLFCRPGWRRDRRLTWVARDLSRLDPARAVEIARGIAGGRVRRQTLRRLGVPASELE
jgi:hypothetical protein